MKDDKLYLIHILECIKRIERYILGGRSGFFADTMVQDAVIRNLQTLSESTLRISDSLKEVHPSVNWRNIAAFRNVVVHDYLGTTLTKSGTSWRGTYQTLNAKSKRSCED